MTSKTVGTFVAFDLIRGFDKNGDLLWSAKLRGSVFGSELGGGQGKANFEWIK
jgi:hypothetical protein